MKELKMVGALIGGAAIGVGLSFPFIMAYVYIFYGIRTLFPSLPHDPSAKELLPFLLGFYAIWFSAVMLLVRRAGQFEAVHLFLIVLPWPSIVIEQMWQSSRII